jgi:hypothetical protein
VSLCATNAFQIYMCHELLREASSCRPTEKICVIVLCEIVHVHCHGGECTDDVYLCSDDVYFGR